MSKRILVKTVSWMLVSALLVWAGIVLEVGITWASVLAALYAVALKTALYPVHEVLFDKLYPQRNAVTLPRSEWRQLPDTVIVPQVVAELFEHLDEEPH